MDFVNPFAANYFSLRPLERTEDLTKQANVLLTKAADQEIDGHISRATLIYRELKNSNAEAKAHLKRISENTSLSFTQKLLHLAKVAEEYGSLHTAFRTYNALLRHGEDIETFKTAELRLKDEKFNEYLIIER